MAITEESRYRLHQRLEEVLGAEQAATMMELFPPVGWADVATKRDLDALGAQLRSDMDVRFAGVREEFASVREEFASVREEFASVRAETAAVRAETAAVRGDMDVRFAGVREELALVRAELHRELRAQLWAVIGANVALAGVLVAAVNLA